jgi:mannosyltransferase
MAIDTLRAPAAPVPPSETQSAPAGAGVLAARAPWRPDWVVVGVLALLVVASAWLRTRTFHAHFWIDEGLSVGIASHKLTAIPGLLKMDGSPPLYYLILHVWMSAFGHGVVATHALSLVFALFTIPAAYWFGATLFDRRTGLITAVLAAGVTYLTQYAQETRMYALLTLLALIVAGTFVEVYVRRRRGYLPVFIVSLAAALYTHNWALFLGLTCGVAFLYCVWAERVDRRALWRDGLIGFGGVVVLYAPWLPTVAYQAKHTGAPWDLPPVLWNVTQGLYTVVGGRGAAVALLLGGGAGLIALRNRGGDRVAMIRLAALSLLILGAGTLLIAFVYSKTTPAWAPRYLAVVVGPLLLLFGLGIARAGALGLVALLLCACFWVLDPQKPYLDSKSNVAAVVSRVGHDLPAGSLVLSTQPEQIPTLAYYMPAGMRYGTPLGLDRDPHIVDWRDALTRFRHASVRRTLAPMLNTVAPGQRVALVVPSRFAKQPLWMRLIHHVSVSWDGVLRKDPRFVRVGFSDTNWNHAGVPVQVTVFERR